MQPAANGRDHWLCTTNSEAAAGRNYVVSQSGARGKTYTVTSTHSCGLLQSCLKQLSPGSTSNDLELCIAFQYNFCDFTSNYFGKAHE